MTPAACGRKEVIMKKQFWKKAAALALVLSLFVSLLSVAAMAEEPDDGEGNTPQALTAAATSSDELSSEIEDPSLEEKEESENPPIDNAVTDTGDEKPPVTDTSLPEQQSDSSGCINGEEHTFGEKYSPNYISCCGGMQTEYYVCSTCHYAFDVQGNMVKATPGDGQHTPGEKHTATYTPCSGGFQTEYYDCKFCGAPVDETGSIVEPTVGNGAHTPGNEKQAANYTSCGGGIPVEYYYCSVCSYPVDADGNEVTNMPGNREHQKLISVPATVPTYEDYGMPAHWECPVCHYIFADSDGKTYTNADNFLLPKLMRGTEVTAENLTTVPDAVKDKFTTVEAIQTALQKAAAQAGFDLNQTNASSVLLDVTLQTKNTDGTLTPVLPEDFPAAGVTVILPYPEGTDGNYTFVITHMITHGTQAGQIEVLQSVNGQDGIYVCFNSMSPVCISYILEGSTPAPAAPAASAGVSTVPKTSDPAHGAPWGMLTLLSIGGLGMLCITGKKLRSF